MREMEEHGITFQNHSRTHDHLIRRLDDETDDDWEQQGRRRHPIRTEPDHSGTRLRPDTVAYPYGEYNLDLKTHGRIHGTDRVRTTVRVAVATGRLRRPAALSDGCIIYASMRTFPNKVLIACRTDHRAFPDDPVVPLDEWQPPRPWC